MNLSQSIEEGNGAAGAHHCRLLEDGQLLVFPHLAFDLSDEDKAFLFDRQLARGHKNIAYDPRRDCVSGCAARHAGDQERLCAIMQAYSDGVARFLATLLPPYASSWVVDYASFRPQEEKQRKLRRRARNDLLHTDAFPSRPTNGDRILRVFTNIHPSQPRCWVTTDTFDVLAKQFAGSGALPLPAPSAMATPMRRWIARAARAAGIVPLQRSPYDTFMLRFHDYLKANRSFQTACRKTEWEFPPNCTWVVFTDFVPHAAVSGRYALEQTFIVARDSLVLPEKAPMAILERLCGTRLTDGTASGRSKTA